MDSRRRVFLVIILVALGFGAGVLLRPRLFPTDEEWARRVHEDTMKLVVLVRPNPWLDEAEFQAAEERRQWIERREAYDAARLAEVRERLVAHHELYLAEYADAAAIYETGRRPEELSEGARAARERFRRLFGELGEKVIAEFDAKLREDAYRVSPKTARGVDPDATDYAEEWRRLREWAPAARARIETLTAAR